jgi:hypothetical protein
VKTFAVLLFGFGLFLSTDAIAQTQNQDAEVKSTEERVTRRNLEINSLQAQANKIDAAAGDYDRSAKAVQERKDHDNYNATCAGKTLYGGQISSCEKLQRKVQAQVTAHNNKMIEYKERFDAVNSKIRDLNNAATVDSAHLQELKNSKMVPSGKAQGSSNAFGISSNRTNPKLGGSSPDTAIPTHSAAEQLSSAAKSGKDAAAAETLEKAKDLSNCQFDKAACRPPDAINIPRPAQTPGAVELARHIPGPAQKDEEIRQSMAYYEKLDGEKIDTKAKLEAVQTQIDSHAGDATTLNAQKATLGNDLKRYEGDQEKTQAQIKERLVTIGVKWDESPAPTTGAKAIQ